MGSDDHRRQALAETGGHVEGTQRTVTQEVNTLQGAAQLVEQRVNLSANAGPPARGDQTHYGRAVTPRDLIEQRPVVRIGALGKPGALEQLIGDALEGGNDGDDRLATTRVAENSTDTTNGSGRRKRRPAEFEDSHAS
jgi:hypothetical protein